MNKIEPLEKFILTFPEDEDGNPVTKYRFIVSLSKPVKEVEQPLLEGLGTIDGIDGINFAVGRYTFEVAIAKTFDADQVIAAIEETLGTAMSDIIQPNSGIAVPQ